jgi:hypothetical protein
MGSDAKLSVGSTSIRLDDGFKQNRPDLTSAVATCESERIEEPWQVMIENRAVIPVSLVAQRACNPTLADAGRRLKPEIMAAASLFGQGRAPHRAREMAMSCSFRDVTLLHDPEDAVALPKR